MTTIPLQAQAVMMEMHPRECVGDGVPVDSPASLLHDCFREYGELRRTNHWWHRKYRTAALHSYNRALQRFHQSVSHHNGTKLNGNRKG